MANNEPGQAVLTVLDRIIERIKSTRPLRSDNKPLENGFVYSQLVLGQMVDPDDFKAPWSPMGGATVHDAVAAAEAPGADPSAKVRRAMQAAFNTSQLVDRLIMVSKDEKMREYPGGGRTISFAYEGIINGMQATPEPPIPDAIQKQINEAQKTLFELDEEGNIVGKSKLHKNYVANAKAYAEAKASFSRAQTAALNDPAKAASFPMESAPLQQEVDDAYDTLKTEGAERIERALGVIESVGVSIQNRMIAKARKVFDAWKLNLAGVPVQTLYSSVSPSSWADPDEDDQGWYHLHVESSDYASHQAQHSHFFSSSSSHQDHSSTSGSASASFFGFGARGGGGVSDQHSSSGGQAGGGSSNVFSNDAEGLSIELEYGLCDVQRPWLIGDLFYLKNWYLVANPKNAVSDGTIEGQADSDKTLLPMIPMQFLVVRNVKIKAEKWNTDGQVLTQFFGASQQSASGHSMNFNAGVNAGWGPFSFRSSTSHEEGRSDASASSHSESGASRDYEAHFNGETLEIKGAQIVAWLSTIVPACAPLGDPGLDTAHAGNGVAAPVASPGASDAAPPSH